jgi:hypothetical protein
MTLLRVARLLVLLLLGSGWGLLPHSEHEPTLDSGSIRLTQAWQQDALP